MKHWVYLLGAGWLVLSLLLSCGSKDAPFINDAGYRQQVEADFLQKQALMPKGNLFAIFQTHLTDYEREALEFLYAYMPLADITDYPGEFHLMNVRAARRAAKEMPWGRTVPEALFRHFVLPVRVNNEPLDSARVVFYDELKPRVQNKSMYDAIMATFSISSLCPLERWSILAFFSMKRVLYSPLTKSGVNMMRRR